jgi:hypothetical protein
MFEKIFSGRNVTKFAQRTRWLRLGTNLKRAFLAVDNLTVPFGDAVQRTSIFAAVNPAKECRGGDGPPCFRADRRDLQQVLFLWVMRLYFGCTDEQYAAILRANGNRYAPSADAPDVPRPRRKRRSRGRGPRSHPEGRPRS